MYNTYLSSTLSFRCKGPLSFSFNDFSCFNDRFDVNPRTFTSQSCCCPCCPNVMYREPIVNPSFLCGLRQSALIQCSASRRLILGSADRYYCRLPGYDVGQSCCCGFVEERSVNGRRGGLGAARFRCRVSEKKSERHRSRDIDNVEEILSLLSEEVGEDCFGVGERNVWSSGRVEEEEKKRGSGTAYRNRKKNYSSGLFVSNLKREVESVRKDSSEVDYRELEDRRKEDKESHLRGKKHRIRKDGSSCSSYYSCGSLGEFESDSEVQVSQEGYRGESLSGFGRSSEETGELTYDGKTVEDVKRRGSVTRDHGVLMQQGKAALGSYTASSGIECDWRKKSEKKLTEESNEQTESWDKSFNKNTRQKFDDRDKTSALELTTGNETRDQYFKKDDQMTGQSESSTKYKKFSRVQEIHDSEQNLRTAGSLVHETRNEQTKTAGLVSQQDEYERNSQKLNKVSKIHEVSDRVTSISQRQSEARVKKREDKSTEILSSVHDTEEHYHVTGQRDSRHMDSRRKFQESTEMSDMHGIDIDNTSASLRHFLTSQQAINKHDKVSKIQEMNDRVTSVSQRQSEARVKKREDESTEILSSVHDTHEHYHITGQRDSRHTDSRRKFQELTEISDTHGINIHNTSASLRQSDTRMENQHFLTHQQANRKSESRKGSQDERNMSVIQSSDAQFIASQRDSKRRISSQDTHSVSVVESTEENIERQNLTEQRVLQIGSRTQTQRPMKTLSFSEGTTKEASGSQAALVLKTQPIGQHIGVNVGVEISSNVIVMPPPSQSVERGPLHGGPTNDFPVQEVSSATLQVGSDGGARRDETHDEHLDFIYHEDALGSAERLQKSSMQFVGEFVEKVTHEVSTSQIQTELATEGQKQHQKTSSQYDSRDFKSKGHESRRSSRSSGKKGPSDDIWDVTDPPIQESYVTEATESESTTPTTKTITKRTGRSLWNIISDIVHFRWAARSSRHTSPQKSGGRSSPIQSVSSEAWFSGHQADESSDGNVKRGKESTTHGSTSSDQHSPATIPMGSQGEGFSSAHLKNKRGSSISPSGPASIAISLGPTEENVGRSGTEVVESSVPMPSLRLTRSPHIDEIAEAGKTAVSASGSLLQEQASDTGPAGKSGTGEKDGELKRRKLQRNFQVPKDRFDEWEEAYKFESEQRRMDEVFMREALLEAKMAADIWEVPVGAVLVQHGKIIARGYNLVEELRDSTAHAEMICIREASNLLRTWRLSETTLYVTLEPCPMCAGAILQARIDTVVWGAPNKLLGADGSWIRLFPNGPEGGNPSEPTDKPPAPIHPFHPKIVVRRGVLETECADAMQQFFQRRRKKEKKADSPPSSLPISTYPSKLLTKMHGAFHF
ncbi:hypothetical protein RHSIM_Rhsim09G0115000 [Rhododendron simsii]|uniref:tRNA(adenine(34)) deaminase n=1 Tax=Rhododendron simsii TaxID=118357 RepID=A0A834LF74_RHOSS|nr:hypothetical protein RHSIM_Rhsim09G0115000 [Rhododendron simsii]